MYTIVDAIDAISRGEKPIPYKDMKQLIFAAGTARDYFGDKTDVSFALYRDHIYIIADNSYYKTDLPPVIDEREALWVLDRHPTAKRYSIDRHHVYII